MFITENKVNDNSRAIGKWERVIIFVTSDSDEAFNTCEWVSNTFTDSFVILQQDSRMVAGGFVDNKVGWKSNTTFDGLKDLCFSPSEYELRCSEKDATLFALKHPISIS